MDKWKAWFKVHNDPLWYTSTARFLTEEDAINHARGKFNTWTQARSWIVVKAGFNPNEEEGEYVAQRNAFTNEKDARP